MSRRDKGQGSVFQRGDGKWVAQITVVGTRRTVYGKSEREARAKLKELQGQAQQGVLRPASNQTLGEYVEWWLGIVQPRLKPSTHEWYGILLRTHVLPTLGRVKLEKLSPTHLTTLYSQELGTLSRTSVRHIHNALRTALADAVKLDQLGTNPALKVDPPKPQRIEPTLWDVYEARRFVSCEQANPTRWSDLWLVLLATGMRIGEALGLTWDCVDLEAGAIEIRQAVVFVDNKPVLSTPKSRTSRRTIAVPDLGVAALHRQHERQVQDRPRLGDCRTDGGFVFLTREGRHPQHNNPARRLREACARAGVPAIHVHHLRHVSTSLLVHSGADVKSVQRRLGHSTLQTTLGVYSHVLSRSDVELAATIDSALAATTR